MPDPTRDELDAYGHVITKIEAATRAALARRPITLALPKVVLTEGETRTNPAA